MVTPYQLLLLAIVVMWPLAIAGLLFLMSRLENYVNRMDAATPEEAGLEPIRQTQPEKEVKIVYGDQVIEK